MTLKTTPFIVSYLVEHLLVMAAEYDQSSCFLVFPTSFTGGKSLTDATLHFLTGISSMRSRWKPDHMQLCIEAFQTEQLSNSFDDTDR